MSSFHFKQFSVNDDRSTMKVGTDAIILGSCADPDNAKRILDIGTGCGVISLMLAQKSSAFITSIDIDKESIDQAKSNFKNSPWIDSMEAKLISLQDFVKTTNETFDLIVSNPPYFTQSLKPENAKRRFARHDDKLSFQELCFGVNKLLSIKGTFYIILPFQDKKSFLEISRKFDLHLFESHSIIPVRGKKANRIVMGLRKQRPKSVVLKEIVIREKDKTHSNEFIEITGDYYIFSKIDLDRRLSENL